MTVSKGTVLSEGIAIGKIHLFIQTLNKKENTSKSKEEIQLKKGIEKAVKEIENLEQIHPEDKEYLDIQLLLIQDPTLIQESLKEIEQGHTAVESVSQVLNMHRESLLKSPSPYLQQRATDISDIQQRIIRNITGEFYKTIDEKFILYAEDLLPSYLIQNKDNLVGIITKNGGYSSHGAILCRQLNIPYMLSDVEVVEGELVLMDTRKQQILKDPTPKTILHYEQTLKDLIEESYQAIPHPNYQFLANVSSNEELDKVKEYGFDGVGLYRTEMIFMNADRPYTLEEQYQIYKEAIEKMEGKPICFRTFDVGDDKQLSYLKTHQKGIDNYKNNPELFTCQIQALLMANQQDNLKIMFPMITSYEEYTYLKNWVNQIKKDLNNSNKIQIGIMLETRDALTHICDFHDVDFISIGTNDLVLDIYHIHRDIQTKELRKYLKDLILKVKEVVLFCKENKIDLSICGELAAITKALKSFMQLGVQNFSVATPAIRILNKVYKELH